MAILKCFVDSFIPDSWLSFCSSLLGEKAICIELV